MKKLTLLILIAAFATSCVMEKRRYTSGYHIDWLQKNNSKTAVAQKEKKTRSNPHKSEIKQPEKVKIYTLEKQDIGGLTVNIQPKEPNTEVSGNKLFASTERKKPTQARSLKNQIERSYKKLNENEPEEKADIWGIISMGSAIVGFLSLFIGGLFESGFGVGIGMTLLLGAFFLAAYSLAKIKHSKEHGKIGFAITGLVISSLVMLFLAAASFAVFI